MNKLDADDRALLVLMRESKRAAQKAEQVYAVIEVMALRRGLVDKPDGTCH